MSSGLPEPVEELLFLKYNYMNFLIHSYLSGPCEDTIFGSLLGDKIKGTTYHKYNPEIVKGILLSKKINAFISDHSSFKNSQSRLNPKFRKHAKHILDVFYDHFLARSWSDYSEISLDEYSEEVCHLLLKRYRIMPYKLKLIFPYIEGSNWIANFATVKGAHASMRELINIGVFRASIEYSIIELTEKYNQYKEDFTILFADLINFVKGIEITDQRLEGSEDRGFYPVPRHNLLMTNAKLPNLFKPGNL
jgi:acyl carrier protein phosphodiesterase